MRKTLSLAPNSSASLSTPRSCLLFLPSPIPHSTPCSWLLIPSLLPPVELNIFQWIFSPKNIVHGFPNTISDVIQQYSLFCCQFYWLVHQFTFSIVYENWQSHSTLLESMHDNDTIRKCLYRLSHKQCSVSTRPTYWNSEAAPPKACKSMEAAGLSTFTHIIPHWKFPLFGLLQMPDVYL